MFVRDYLNFDLLIETATDGQRRPGSGKLPWEYLYARPLHRFLVLSEQTTLVRYLEVGYPSQPLAVTSPRHRLAVAVGGLAFQEGVMSCCVFETISDPFLEGSASRHCQDILLT